MKRILIVLMTVLAFQGFAQTNQNFDLSTMRIGNFKLNMLEVDAIKIAGKPLQKPTEANNYDGKTVVKYNNELVYVTLSDNYVESTGSSQLTISEISTKSSKFKTKSGMGIGSTKDELWNAYKEMNHIEIYRAYDDNGNRTGSEINFTVYDDDASTFLTFVMTNNKVVEIKIGIEYEGC